MILEDTYHQANFTTAKMFLYDLLNKTAEEDFKPILQLVCYVCKCENASISFINGEIQDVKYTEGLITPTILKLSDSFCQFTIDNDDFTEITSLKTDDRTKSLINSADFPFNYYAGIPFRTLDGDLAGTICVINEKSKTLENSQVEALKTLVKQFINVLDLRKKNLEGIQNKKSKEEFDTLFNVSPDLICVLDENQKILTINKAAFDILGYTPDECSGVNISKFILPDDRMKVLNVATQSLSTGIKSFEVETRLKSKSGILKWISWKAITRSRKWFIIGREITEQKELLKHLNQLSTVASKINNGVVISNANNEVIWVNSAFTDITGFELADLENNKLGDVVSGEHSNKNIIEEARKATENKKSFSVELLAYTKAKKAIWLSIFNTIILDEKGNVESLIEIVIDITERKKTEEKLGLLSLVASETEIGVSISDQYGKVKWINDSLVKLLGYNLDELEGKCIGDVVKGENTDHNVLIEARDSAGKFIPYTIELQVYKKDGTAIWLSISNTPIHDENENTSKQIEIISDITQRKEVEFQLIEAKEQAVQLSRAKEMFLSVMSHEIRTPLNAIIGLTNLLDDEDKLESQKQSIKLLKFSADNLLELINDILDFSKIEVGKMELENKRLSISDLIKDIADSLVFKTKDKDIIIKYQIDKDIPPLVRGDKTRLYQILINLINNAIKFTDKGYVEILVDLISIDSKYTRLNFKVIDTGIGIPEDKFEYIFESFTQAASNTTRKYGGSGLGLTITKKLIELYDGSINVMSKLGEGSTFEFDLKFNNFIDVENIEISNNAEENKLLNAKILVVDDNEINRILAKRVLNKYGIEVVLADSGLQAIHLLQAKDYDLVLMDVHMPDLTGYETVAKLRENGDPYFNNLPIIALTASILKEDIGDIETNGMVDYQLKPFKPDDLFEKIVKHIKK